jgi:selenocysteine lyase/cysteine desulfurase
MEHHSNQTSWLETIADVAVIPATEDGLFSTENLEILLEKYKTEVLKLRQLLPPAVIVSERLITRWQK